MRCEKCNAYIPEGATYCHECGMPLDSSTLCQKCGTPTSPKSKFCRKCGAPVDQRIGKSMNPKAASAIRQEAAQARCPRCNSGIPSGTKYCPTCGSSIETIITKEEKIPEIEVIIEKRDPPEPVEGASPCPICGTISRGSGRFCHECGKLLMTDIEDVICPTCGSTNILRYARCQYCGQDLPARPKSNK